MIIVDTREQKPWDFTFFGCETLTRKLEFGDYSVAGRENDVFIERKATTSEIAVNLCNKEGARRFDAEMERSGSAKKILICEFPQEYLDVFPEKSGIPRSRIKTVRVGAKFLRKRLHEVVEKYNIELLFAPNRYEAELIAFEQLEPYFYEKSM
jgi:hypothetical protein